MTTDEIAREIIRERYRTEQSCSLLYQEFERSARRLDASQCLSLGMKQHEDGSLGPPLRCQGRIGHAGDCDLGPATGLEWAKAHVPIFAQCHLNFAEQIGRVWAGHHEWARALLERHGRQS